MGFSSPDTEASVVVWGVAVWWRGIWIFRWARCNQIPTSTTNQTGLRILYLGGWTACNPSAGEGDTFGDTILLVSTHLPRRWLDLVSWILSPESAMRPQKTDPYDHFPGYHWDCLAWRAAARCCSAGKCLCGPHPHPGQLPDPDRWREPHVDCAAKASSPRSFRAESHRAQPEWLDFSGSHRLSPAPQPDPLPLRHALDDPDPDPDSDQETGPGNRRSSWACSWPASRAGWLS